jgi:hypothetical protein
MMAAPRSIASAPQPSGSKLHASLYGLAKHQAQDVILEPDEQKAANHKGPQAEVRVNIQKREAGDEHHQSK